MKKTNIKFIFLKKKKQNKNGITLKIGPKILTSTIKPNKAVKIVVESSIWHYKVLEWAAKHVTVGGMGMSHQ